MSESRCLDWLPEWPGPRIDAELGLVCIPHAGAMHSAYCSWQKYFGDRAAVRSVAMPGRGARLREDVVTDMNALVTSVVTAIDSLPWREVALFGDCSGSIIALAISKALRASGSRRVRHLFAAGVPNPAGVNPVPRHALSDEAFGSWAVDNGLLPQAVLGNAPSTAYFLKQMRADFFLCETYKHPLSRVDCPITTFVGSGDRRASESFVAWSAQTDAHWQHHVLESGHLVGGDPNDRLKSIIAETLELSGGATTHLERM